MRRLPTRTVRVLLGLALAVTAAGCARTPGGTAGRAHDASHEPQWEGRASLPAATARALALAASRGARIEEDLRHLTDVIGPRLTGSAAVRRANEWAANRLREHPLDTVWLESFSVPAAWERGPLTLTQVAPHRALLRATTLAWSPPTPGTITGEVLVWQGGAGDAPRLGGVATPDVRNAWMMFPEGGSEGLVSGIADDSTLALVAVGRAAGVLLSGPDDPLRMLRLGSPMRRPPLPHVVLPRDSYDRFVRLWSAGIPARIEGSVSATLTPGSVAGYNTLAEVRGSEWPGEVVLVAVPLDSWDDAVLSLDDAAAVAATLEAARIVAVARVRPRRTIRFAFLGGELQAGLGAAEYMTRHAPSLLRHVAIIGAGAPLDGEELPREGVTVRVRPDLEEFWHSVRSIDAGEAGPLAIEVSREPPATPLATVEAPYFVLRVVPGGGDADDRAGALSVARDAARHMAIAAVALAELESFPR